MSSLSRILWQCVACLLCASRSAGASIGLEAERAEQVVFPARIVADGLARGGRCVNLGDADPFYDDGVQTGALTLSFNVDEKGVYCLWARVKWHCRCSRFLAVRTSGSVHGADGPGEVDGITGAAVGEEPHRAVTSYTSPGVWQWVLCGTYCFDSGPQTIQVIQRTHTTLVDALVLSRDVQFRPPDFVDATKVLRLPRQPRSWQPKGGGRTLFPVGERLWSDSVVDVSLSLPNHGPPNANAALGIGFCVQEDRSGYYVLMSRGPSGGTSVRLAKCYDNTTYGLAAEEQPEASDAPYAVRVLRAGERILVMLSGRVLFDVNDAAYPSGRVYVVADNLTHFQLEDIEITPVRSYSHVFLEEQAPGWRELAGKWRVTSQNAMDTFGGAYMGVGQGAGVSIPPWSLGSRYSFAASVQLIDAEYAGIAFDVGNSEHFSAFVLKANEESDPPALNAGVVRVDAGRPRWLWTSALNGNVDQWCRLELVRQSGVVSLRVDGDLLARFRYSDSCDAPMVGFAVDGTAVFANPTAVNTTPYLDGYFGFEPEIDSRALSRWRRRSGSFASTEHPAALACSALPGETEFRLELREAVYREVELCLEMPDDTYAAENADFALGGDLPGLRLPVLPGGPRIGVAVSFADSREKGHEYSVSVDQPEMRSLVIARNGQELARADGVRSSSHHSNRLHVQVGREIVTARLSTGLEAQAPLEKEELGDGTQCSVAVYGARLRAAQTMYITSISVSELLPWLDTPPTPDNEQGTSNEIAAD